MVPVAIGRAQAPSCTYERCALRVQHKLTALQLVQGADTRRVAKLGFFVPRIPLLAGAEDSVRIPYEQFRSAHNRATVFQALSAVSALTAFAVSIRKHHSNNPTLGLVSLGFATLGGINSRISEDRLERAIWFYNRRFAASP
jgi:hypothetical protein